MKHRMPIARHLLMNVGKSLQTLSGVLMKALIAPIMPENST